MAALPKRFMDRELLQATLDGLRLQRTRIDDQIAMIERMLPGGRARRGTATATVAAGPAVRRRRAMSASARKRIADAQKKRWAEYRKKKGPKSE